MPDISRRGALSAIGAIGAVAVSRTAARTGSGGTVRWRVQLSTQMPGLAVADGMVFAGSCALAAATGRRVWQTRNPVFTAIQSVRSGIVAGPGVVCGVNYTAPDEEAAAIVALKAATGQPLWTHDQAAAYPLACAGGLLYTPSDSSLLALDMRTGRPVWSSGYDGGPATPVIADGVAFATANGSLTSKIVALNASTGALRWEISSPDMPAYVRLVVVDGILCAYAGREGAAFISAFRLASGHQLWETRLPAYGAGQLAAAAGGVYFAAKTGASNGPATVWAMNPQTGAPRWTRSFSHSIALTGPAAAPGAVYLNAFPSGTMYALSAATGVTLWQRALRALNIVVAGDSVYAVDWNSAVWALRP
jgi:outer membrane protein assembly factor BamB